MQCQREGRHLILIGQTDYVTVFDIASQQFDDARIMVNNQTGIIRARPRHSFRCSDRAPVSRFRTGQRHREIDCGPYPLLALSPHLSAMKLDESLADRETEAGPLGGLLVPRMKLLELLKQAG